LVGVLLFSFFRWAGIAFMNGIALKWLLARASDRVVTFARGKEFISALIRARVSQDVLDRIELLEHMLGGVCVNDGSARRSIRPRTPLPSLANTPTGQMYSLSAQIFSFSKTIASSKDRKKLNQQQNKTKLTN
jgi:hypothetical protein